MDRYIGRHGSKYGFSDLVFVDLIITKLSVKVAFIAFIVLGNIIHSH